MTAQTIGLEEVFDMAATCNCLDVMLGQSKMRAGDGKIPVNGKIGWPSGKSRLTFPIVGTVVHSPEPS
jgi:hypothetical protein